MNINYRNIPAELKDFRKQWGNTLNNFFTTTNPKALKSEIPTLLWHGMPRAYNACPAAGTCCAVCLHNAGNPAYQTIKNARRLIRSKSFLFDQKRFMRYLMYEIIRYKFIFNRQFAVRLNGTTDFKWEDFPIEVTKEDREFWLRYGVDLLQGQYDNIMLLCRRNHVNVRFYDYTKRLDRDFSLCRLLNYHLTLSYGSIHNVFPVAAQHGLNVAVPFNIKKSQDLPQFIEVDGDDWAVIDGDKSDFRPNDPKTSCVVGLRYKVARSKSVSPEVIKQFCWN